MSKTSLTSLSLYMGRSESRFIVGTFVGSINPRAPQPTLYLFISLAGRSSFNIRYFSSLIFLRALSIPTVLTLPSKAFPYLEVVILFQIL